MQRETLIFASEADWLEARKHDLTSTDIAELFGVGRSSPFELWHRKHKHLDSDFEGNERSDWGLALQDAIMAKHAKDQGWQFRRMNEYIRLPELRLASSFDFEITVPDSDDPELNVKCLAEVKNVDGLIVKDKWLIGEDGEYEATPQIELQFQHQMLISGHTSLFGCICVGGNKGLLLHRTANPKIHQAILDRAAFFWASIDQATPPEPDYFKDAHFISSLYKSSEEGKVLDATVDDDLGKLFSAYKEAQEANKMTEAKKDAVKAEILSRIGDASKVVFSGGSLSCGIVKEALIPEHMRASYRMFKTYWKK